MRQTVVGVYESYADACAAQRALMDGGFPQADISIYAMSTGASSSGGPRVYAPGGGDVRRDRPVFDQIEQLFARLFTRGAYPPETEDYREVIRRGGAIVSADVPDVQVDLACDVMRRTGAADIEERAKAWREREAQAAQAPDRGGASGREGSSVYPSDQSAAQQDQPPSTAGASTQTQRSTFSSSAQQSAGGMRQMSPRTDEGSAMSGSEPAQPRSTQALDVEPERGSIGTGGALHSDTESWRDDAASSASTSRTAPASGSSGTAPMSGAAHIGDPLMGTPLEGDDGSYDDEFRRDYDSRYANTGAAYDEYRRAYTHGATYGRDERYSGQDWQQVEPSARAHWESRYPESAWERFKAAVRHGWERVTKG